MKTLILRGAATLITVLAATSANAYDFKAGDLCYNIIEGGVEVTSENTIDLSLVTDSYYYEGTYHFNDPDFPDAKPKSAYTMQSVTIPKSVTYNNNEYQVIAIGERAFSLVEELKTIVFPEGLKRIGAWAFQSCTNLQDVTLPSTLEKLEMGAFSLCTSLTTMTIPDNVTRIEKHALSGCYNMRTVTLGRNVAWTGLNWIGTGQYVHFEKHPTQGYENWFCYRLTPTRIEHIYYNSATPPATESTDCNLSLGRIVPGQIRAYWKEDAEPWDPYIKCVLHVPAGSLGLYKETADYSICQHVTDGTESGISEIVDGKGAIRVEGGRIVADGHVEVYDLSGRKVATGEATALPDLPAGLYIVRAFESAAKVAIH